MSDILSAHLKLKLMKRTTVEVGFFQSLVFHENKPV